MTLLTVNDGDLHSTTITVLVGSSSGFSALARISSASLLFEESSSRSSFPVSVRAAECTGDFCEDRPCDRLLSPISSGARRLSCSGARNLLKLSLRTNECDFFFFFVFAVVAKTGSTDVGFCFFSSPSSCRDISAAKEDLESIELIQFLEDFHLRGRERKKPF